MAQPSQNEIHGLRGTLHTFLLAYPQTGPRILSRLTHEVIFEPGADTISVSTSPEPAPAKTIPAKALPAKRTPAKARPTKATPAKAPPTVGTSVDASTYDDDLTSPPPDTTRTPRSVTRDAWLAGMATPKSKAKQDLALETPSKKKVKVNPSPAVIVPPPSTPAKRRREEETTPEPVATTYSLQKPPSWSSKKAASGVSKLNPALRPKQHGLQWVQASPQPAPKKHKTPPASLSPPSQQLFLEAIATTGPNEPTQKAYKGKRGRRGPR